MQDIHSIAGANRLFTGGGAGGDRRLRPHLHHHQSNHQALKCPRCDSLNTKFCYYNNYNLSQPRHFCKSCRRYWTKGGVLRNVPVGGGCRKTKRSSKSKSSPESATPPPLREHKSNSHSSSESSSLTATTTATAAAAVLTEEVSGQTGNQNFESDPPMMEQGIFSEIGSFTSLITSTTETLPFGFNNIADVTPFTLNQQGNHHHHQQQQFQTQWNQPQRIQEMTLTSGFMDQTAQIDPNRSSNVGFGSLDWQTNGDGEGEGDQGLFDLPNTVDQAYWSQNQWTDPIQDQPNLYLP